MKETVYYRIGDGGPVINFLADMAGSIGTRLLKWSLPHAKVHVLDLDSLNDAYYDTEGDGEMYDSWLDLERNTLENTETSMFTHEKKQCVGEYCTIHNRSNHVMRGFPQHFRFDRMLMERTCPHGTGHPDPDEIKLTGPNGWVEAVHGCDGCCGAEITKGK
jgi:hypothetical protein